jgi:hypothetical protein
LSFRVSSSSAGLVTYSGDGEEATVGDCGHAATEGRPPVRRGDVYPACPPLTCPAPHFPLAPSPCSSPSCFRRLRTRERRAAPADPPLRPPSVSFHTSAAAAVSPWPCLAVDSVEVGSSLYMARFDPCLRFPCSFVFIGRPRTVHGSI